MAPSMTRLTTEMTGAKRKYIALELFQLEINARGIRCQITPSMLNCLFIRIFSATNSSTSAPASPFSYAVSFTCTRLEDIDASLIYQCLSEDQELTERETAAIYDATYLIVSSANQLTKVMKIIAGIFGLRWWQCPHLMLLPRLGQLCGGEQRAHRRDLKIHRW